MTIACIFLVKLTSFVSKVHLNIQLTYVSISQLFRVCSLFFSEIRVCIDHCNEKNALNGVRFGA